MTTWIALYAAVVSTSVFGWNIYVYLRENSRIRLTALHFPSSGFYVIRVTNIGRKEVTISTVGITQAVSAGLGNHTVTNKNIASGLPCRIKDGDSAYFVTVWSDKEPSQPSLTYVWANDARGGS